MLTWVVYDISKDRTRTKIAKRCLDFGLYRVQKSVFLGDIAAEPGGGDPAVQPGTAEPGDGCGVHLPDVPRGFRQGADRRPGI